MVIETAVLDRLIGDDWSGDIPPLCIACGYNLTGLTANRCPECGRRFSRAELKRRATELRFRLMELEGLNEWVSLGFTAWIGGAVVRVAGLVLGSVDIAWLASLCRLAAFPCGFAAVCLGLSVLRAHRVPPWARGMLAEQPKYPLAVATTLLGALLAASVFAPL